MLKTISHQQAQHRPKGKNTKDAFFLWLNIDGNCICMYEIFIVIVVYVGFLTVPFCVWGCGKELASNSNLNILVITVITNPQTNLFWMPTRRRSTQPGALLLYNQVFPRWYFVINGQELHFKYLSFMVQFWWELIRFFSIFPIYALPLWLIPIFPGLCSFEMPNKEREYDCIEVRKMLSAILLAGKSPCWCHPASHPGVLIAGSWCKRWAGRLGPDSRLTHGPHVGHAAANTFALKH